MTKLGKLLCFVFAPIALAVLGEFVLKWSLNCLAITVDFYDPGLLLSTLLMMLKHPGVLFGIFSVLLSALLWLVALSKFEMSFIYPFLSLNYVLVVLGSPVLLGEQLTGQRLLALSFIVLGLFVISRSPYFDA